MCPSMYRARIPADACVAPRPASADLRVSRPTRMLRLERVDFEELVDDVPGLASAICRGLGERARVSSSPEAAAAASGTR